MSRAKSLFHPFIYFLMAVYMLLAFLVPALGNRAIAFMIPEDHYFEYVGAISLFIASLFFSYCLVQSLKPETRERVPILRKLVYLGMACLFFFGAGEEISWGQRLLQLQTPAGLAPVNTQEELNLHNLKFFMDGSFFTVDRLFDIFWFLLAVAVPLAVLLVPRLKKLVVSVMPVVPIWLGGLFLWDYVLAKLAKLAYRGTYSYDPISLQQAVQEIKESNYSVLFVMAGLYAAWEFKQFVRHRQALQEKAELASSDPAPA